MLGLGSAMLLFLANVTDIDLVTGKTAYENRFGIQYAGHCIPFGTLVRYKPESVKGKFLICPFGENTLPAIFIGYD